MTIRLIRRDPHNHDKLQGDLEAQERFSRMGWLNVFFKLNGYDEIIALEFYQGFKLEKNRDSHSYKFQTTVRGLNIFVDEALISQMTEKTMG